MISDSTIAIVILLSVLVIFAFSRASGRDRFVSQQAQEVYKTSRDLFDKTGGNASYSEYKTVLEKNADPVVYTDTRKLWKEGRLSPESVQKVI
jgi:hypothetical protein